MIKCIILLLNCMLIKINALLAIFINLGNLGGDGYRRSRESVWRCSGTLEHNYKLLHGIVDMHGSD